MQGGPARGAQWRSHGPLQWVPILRRGTPPGGRGGRGISHLDPLPTLHQRLAGASRVRRQTGAMKITRITMPALLATAVMAAPAVASAAEFEGTVRSVNRDQR